MAHPHGRPGGSRTRRGPGSGAAASAQAGAEGGAPGAHAHTPCVEPAPGAPPQRWGPILGGALALALLLGGAAFWFLSPTLEKERAGARTAAEALPERRFSDDGLGFALDLPEGWLLLRSDSTLFVAPQSRARFAHARASAQAALHFESIPPGVISLDAFIDSVVDLRRPLVSDYREVGRVEVAQGGRPARRLQASWLEHGAEQRVTVVATRDAWAYVALAVWGPARGGAPVQDAIDALLRGLQLSGVLTSRLKAAADVVEPDLPELSRSSLELILRDRLGSGGAPDEAADAAVRAVSQGLAALSPAEAQELQQIYALVYDPMPEESRQRLAAWQREVRAGRRVAAEEAQPLRLLLKDALLALPEEARLRLQALNEKSIGAAYALR